VTDFELAVLDQTTKVLKVVLEERNALRERLAQIAALSERSDDPATTLRAIRSLAQAPDPLG
jgi:hypothetical protein